MGGFGVKDFFHTHNFRVLLGTVAVLLAFMLYSASMDGTLTASLFSFVSSPLERVSTLTVNNASAAVENATVSIEELQEEIRKLEEENQQLRDQLVDYYEMKQKNEQYESILEIKENNDDFQMVSAAVISRDPAELFGGFTIDQGRLSGISVNDPVITSEGVVGWVSKVEATTSYVTTILSPDTNIGVISKEKRESGVVSSDLLLADQGLVRMSYLTDETKLEEGDIITTTGLAGIFPKDLIVGQVKILEVSDGGVTRCALIEPYVDVKEVHDVFVITDFYGKGEISESTTDTTSQEDSEKETSSESSEESAKGDS